MLGGHLRTARTVALISAVLCVAAGCASAGGAASSAAPSQATVTSGPKTGDLFLTGVVRRGRTPVREAVVVVELMSADDDIEVGDEVPTWDTKPVRTDSQGRYAIRLDPDVVPGKFFEAPDFLNFDLYVTLDKTFATWGGTLWLVGQPQVWRTDQARTGDAVADMTVDLASKTITVTDSEGKRTRSSIPVRG